MDNYVCACIEGMYMYTFSEIFQVIHVGRYTLHASSYIHIVGTHPYIKDKASFV